MRWLVFAILAYVAVGLQAGLSPYLRYNGGDINFVLLAVLFISLNAPREPALLGAFLLGLLQDVMSMQGLGLYAFGYGVVAMFTVTTQEVVYREHPLTHFTLALVSGMMLAVLLAIHALLKVPAPIGGPFVSGLMTAVAAPIVLGVLQRCRRAFAFERRSGIRRRDTH